MYEDAEQAVDAANRLEAMEGAADGAADRPQDHRQDQSYEHAEDGAEVQELLHLVRVLIVESKDHEESAEEKDLRHERLDDTALISEEQSDDKDQHDDDVDDHAVLGFDDASSRRASMTR